MYLLYLPKSMFSPADGANSQRPLRSSLQMRLTLGAIAAIWGGLGLGMLWMSWRTERMFLSDHRAKLSAVVQQMPDQEVAIAQGSASASDLQGIVKAPCCLTWNPWSQPIDHLLKCAGILDNDFCFAIDRQH